MATFNSTLAALLVAVTLLWGACQALEVVNKGSSSIVVFVPPICQPCKCPQIQCIRAPCVQPQCFCPALCRFVPGVVVKSKTKVTLTVEKTAFPLAFLTVEVGEVAYVVNARDLKEIGFIATVEVTGQSCGKGKQGIQALVFPNPKFYGFQRICLMRGERYGT